MCATPPELTQRVVFDSFAQALRRSEGIGNSVIDTIIQAVRDLLGGAVMDEPQPTAFRSQLVKSTQKAFIDGIDTVSPIDFFESRHFEAAKSTIATTAIRLLSADK